MGNGLLITTLVDYQKKLPVGVRSNLFYLLS